VYALAVVLSLAIGLSLGMLGGGGSILTVPILVYALGVDKKTAITESMVVVGVTSLVALIGHARAGRVAWRTGLGFGAAGMVGALAGSMVHRYLSGEVLLLLFGVLMILAALAMFRVRKEVDPATLPPQAPWRVATDGFAVGVVTGVVGAGGGFLLVPALTTFGRLPLKTAIGTSLLVIAMNTAAAFLPHLGEPGLDGVLTAMVTGSAVVGALIGSALSERVPVATLRKGFGAFVLVMAVFQIGQELVAKGWLPWR
jgi:uncharacterized membrane protein YfcA